MKLFVVVGMHRSGTSIVSRLLNLLGAHLGPEDDLMPPKPDNPTGFWEALLDRAAARTTSCRTSVEGGIARRSWKTTGSTVGDSCRS